MQTKTTAKDFFLYVGVLITLYSGIGFLLNLLFGIIDHSFPPINSYFYQSSISLQVAALIVLTPVFLLLSYLINKDAEADPTKKDLNIRRWFIFLTLFGTGALVVGDLITILYYFLDGRDLTSGFLLKAPSVLVVSGIVFGYYLSELRNKISHRNVWRVGTLVGVLAVIVLAFSVIGSPATQRQLRYDSQRLSDLQNIQSQVLNYYQQKGEVPESLEGLNDSLSHFVIPNDPESGESYRFEKVSALSFKLCANFDTESNERELSQTMHYGMDVINDNWKHAAGQACFDRTIDPERYPVFEKPRL